jgi:hypothetical protein
MTRDEASKLYREITDWYFDSGNGMMLTSATSSMYVEAKRRLAEFAAEGAAPEPDWHDSSERRLRELSLLRTQMKSDLSVYGRFYPGSLSAEDESFVRCCGLNPKRWARPPLHRVRERATAATRGQRGRQ